jgi:two-component system, OmpR family, sensor histidine kinase SenX3
VSGLDLAAGAVIAAVAALAGAAVVEVLHRRRVRALARRLAGVAEVAEHVAAPPAGDLGAAVEAVEQAAAGLTERRNEVTAAESRLASALEAIPQGVVIYDESGHIAYANDQATGYLAARHGDALVEEAIAELVEVAVAQGDASRSVEVFGPPRRTLEVRALPLGREGDRLGVLVVIDDVSARRRLEAVRRDFVANISHELKTPVGALVLLAETLLSEDDPAVAQRLAQRLLDESLRVSRTIDDLLELSRIEAEEQALRDPVPVHLCVAEAVDRVRPAAERRSVELVVEEPDARATVVGDRRQLVSAISNLLDNAVKYSDADSTVEVRARTDGQWVEIGVQDHGIGIPRRDLGRIFERFYRVDRARSRDTGGTGLGLAIVRHVANNHHGEVSVQSQEGEGSTFTLRLPAGPGPVLVTAEAG